MQIYFRQSICIYKLRARAVKQPTENLKTLIMKKFNFLNVSFLLLTLAITLSSCEAIGSIFKAGMWTGLIIVAIIIAIILYFVNKSKN